MNILVSNKYRNYLISYDYNLIKEITGEYDSKDLISLISTIQYNKLIIDLTAIKGYTDLKNIRELINNVESSRIILLLSNEVITTSKYYLSNLINMGIYNFTLAPGEIVYLLQYPRTYKQAKEMVSKSN